MGLVSSSETNKNIKQKFILYISLYNINLKQTWKTNILHQNQHSTKMHSSNRNNKHSLTETQALH